MDFVLSPEDAAELRHLATVEPEQARAYLQDRPDLAKRMTEWPPELRIEVCRILYRSFSEAQRTRMQDRKHGGSNLLDLLGEQV